MSKVGTRLAFYEDECNGELIYGTVVKPRSAILPDNA